MTPRASGLEKVQSLYVLQFKLWDYLDSDLTDPDKRREAKKTADEFTALLKEVDPRYMGGEDVYATLQSIPENVLQKIKKLRAKEHGKTPTRSRAAAKKAPAKKTKPMVRRPVKKAAVKKAVARKAKPAAKKHLTKKRR